MKNKLEIIKKLNNQLKSLIAEEKIKNNELNKYCDAYEKQYDKMLNTVNDIRNKIELVTEKLEDELASTKSGGRFSIKEINSAKKMLDELGFNVVKK